ncbi:all-trans retinoic acid-induced differentiation factor isoform X2 [Denticeps clupeoides]|uniref:EGF-like domain-containing protein n=1 Tax=Denticeps clupeoides TaxID=299321 RepID=A0AAY4AY39_9TELE|nr:all-trans retinoic acid-induced differentiation factor isoform X2 [Denticeps clupeoides]
MTAASSLFTVFAFFLLLNCRDVRCEDTELRVCHMCRGSLQNNTAVGNFCLFSSDSRVEGRCCLRKTGETLEIIGLDISNCSLNVLENLKEASAAIIIDLSHNPLSNLSDLLFVGFSSLNNVMLPSHLLCPGGNESWHKTEVKGDLRFCDGQRDACNQTGQMSWDCPENSLCAPYGPGFFECACASNFHGYKCLREGEFPVVNVLGILCGSTCLVSLLLWLTQRRKAKDI